jgi:1,4-dihydroxy-6-naphthoate synthase
MKISLGFSPCPNDTFIFDALVNRKIDTEGVDFEVFMEDVETLNQKSFRAELDVTKLSFHTLGYVREHYELSHSGSALGEGVGPLIISKKDITAEDILKGPVAIPGKYTTAHFLLKMAFPAIEEKREMLFSEIEEAVMEEKVIAGLIIHENRFTYAAKGLKKFIDLGEFWENKTGLPIPLGGIAIKRNLPVDLKVKIDKWIRQSVEFAFNNPYSGSSYIRAHSQEMDEEVLRKHIGLYVNDYTIELGHRGIEAVQKMFDIADQLNLIPFSNQPLITEKK